MHIARVARRRFAAARSDERVETQRSIIVRLRFRPFIRAGDGRRSRPTCDALG